jgi:chemotaxis protein MotB
MAKKREKKEEAGSNWMDTWTDLVSLLMCFFVLLFAFSTVDVQMLRAISSYFTGAVIVDFSPLNPSQVFESPVERFGYPGMTDYSVDDPDDEGPESIEGGDKGVDPVLEAVYGVIMGYIGEYGIGAELRLDVNEFTIRIIFDDQVFFNSGDAALLPGASNMIDHIIEMFINVEQDIYRLSVEGHTDNRPINTARFPSNWELSAERALSVMRYIRSDGRIDPRSLKMAGYGEEYPIDTNTTAEGRARNRRVEFIFEVETPDRRERRFEEAGGN